MKRFPFDKDFKASEVLQTEPLKEAFARFEYIKRRGGILLLTGDPGVGKTLALRTYVDSLKERHLLADPESAPGIQGTGGQDRGLDPG